MLINITKGISWTFEWSGKAEWDLSSYSNQAAGIQRMSVNNNKKPYCTFEESYVTQLILS
jgi:hypothetical protein